MSYSYDTLIQKATDKIGENVNDINDSLIDSLVQDAIYEYSRVRAREKVTDFTGDGTAYSFTLPSDWMDGFSVVKRVEYPFGEQEPEIIKPYKYRVYRGTAGVTFRMVKDTPSSTGTVRVTYLLPHTGSSSSFTIPDSDVSAVAALAASKLARQLAAQNARTQASTMDADVVNYLSQVASWNTLADKLEDEYKALIGIPKNGNEEAVTDWADWDMSFAWGENLLTHPRSWR